MRKLILALFLVNAALWSIPGHALSITGGLHDGVEVGIIDTLIETTDIFHSGNSSTETETAWVNSVLNESLYASPVKWTVKTDGVSYYSVDDGDNNNVFAFHVNAGFDVPMPDYFIIKNATGTALFHNNALVEWGVFDVSLMAGFNPLLEDFGGFNLGGGEFTISHVTEFVVDDSDRDFPVPEPSISALLGLGLLGMLGVGRRKA